MSQARTSLPEAGPSQLGSVRSKLSELEHRIPLSGSGAWVGGVGRLARKAKASMKAKEANPQNGMMTKASFMDSTCEDSLTWAEIL